MSEVQSVPEKSRWSLAEGDPIAPGINALRLLGGGKRYEAYLAWDDRLQSLVVTKIVRPEFVTDGRTLQGLAAEVELLGRLQHPVLVRSFGASVDGPMPHVVLEHLEGPRLSSLLRKYGPLSIEQLLPLGLQLCAAAHYLAGAGIVHRDIKPSNIIMGAPPRLIDLSVARSIEECRAATVPVGTDAYMAPEQCVPTAETPVGPPADVWGIGATLYEAATGRRAFVAGDSAYATEAVRRWPQLAGMPPDPAPLPDLVAAPIMACLSHDPADRPAAAAVLAQLENALAATPRRKIKVRRRR